MVEKSAGKGERQAFVRHGKLRRSSGWGNALRVLLTTAIVVSLSGAATVAYAAWGLFQNVNTVELEDEAAAIAAGSQSLDGAVTILLVGSDTREGQAYDDGEEGELNDVNLLLTISEDHKNATVVSFPRDTMVPIPSCPGPNGEPDYYGAMSEQQLNSAMQYGGLPCVAKTIEELSGTDIQYAGKITFDGVIGVSNAIGGVDVCLTQPIEDPAAELDLPAGVNTLKGWDALQYLRTRHGVGDGGDTSRISNQQIFMSALMRKLKSADTLSDPLKVYALAKAGVENMQLSSNMASVPFMQALAGTVKDIDLDNINFVQYPTADHPYEEGRLTPDYAAAETLFQVIASGQPFAVTEAGEGVAVEGEDPTATADPNAVPTDPNGVPLDENGLPVDPNAVPTDPNAVPTDPNAPVETTAPGSGTGVNEDGTTTLPPGITGQQASTETCSAGRTVL